MSLAGERDAAGVLAPPVRRRDREVGYTPEVATSHGGRTARVTLAHCAFLELTRTNPAVVSGIHRGLVAGSLEQLGEPEPEPEPEPEVSLVPFVDATTCLAHITTRTTFRPAARKEPA